MLKTGTVVIIRNTNDNILDNSIGTVLGIASESNDQYFYIIELAIPVYNRLYNDGQKAIVLSQYCLEEVTE